MPRSVATDLMQSFRFRLRAFDADNVPRLSFSFATGPAQAGFSSVGTPSGSVEVVEYREGHYIYTRKFPGIPSMDDITAEQGVVRGNSTMWAWMLQSIEGKGNYRCTVEVRHYHRDKAYLGSDISQPPQNPISTPQNTAQILTEIPEDATPGRIYRLFEAFAQQHKPSGDLEGTGSEVSVATMGISYEYFDILEVLDD